MNKTIGIMGCGWLGLPLAQFLLKLGYSVKGTTSTASRLTDLKSKGVSPYLITIKEQEIDGPLDTFLEGMDVLIVNIPPGLRKSDSGNYVAKMKRLKSRLQESVVNRVIFVSSTSVYGNLSGEIRETTTPQPSTESSRQLLEAEQLFVTDDRLDTAIVRFGGLIGPGRHPARQLSGRKGLKNGNQPVNLIHLDDCLHILTAVLQHGWWNMVFNAVYPEYPLKKDYYTSECKKLGLAVPEYLQTDKVEGKKVIPAQLVEKGYVFTTGISSYNKD
ncbi:MAG: SDR family oxidoreductase [Eudoraea sp.]|nr:SDR family oxidoreductase [Eudoraea sp.]